MKHTFEHHDTGSWAGVCMREHLGTVLLIVTTMIGCCWCCVGNNGRLLLTVCTVGNVAHATFVCATMVAGLSLCVVTNCFILFSRTIKKV